MSRILRPSSIRSAVRQYATVSDAAVGGVKVAAIDAGQPTSSVTVVVKAGSRFETTPGVAHCLKNFAFKSTAQGSALKTIREAELYGGVLSSALSREHLFLSAEFLRGDEDHFLELLAAVLSSTKFSPHEYNELVLPTVQSESMAALQNPRILALDVAHQLAFRRGLGNSLFASPHSPVTAQQVRDYAQQAFAKSNLAVFGTGISTETLTKAVGSAFGSSSSAASGSSLSGSATQYYGGEHRLPLDAHSSGSQPAMVIAFGSNSAPTPELSVLSHLLGGTSGLKWAPGVSPLSLAADKIPGASAKAFVLPYSDAGLFGVVITAPTSEGVKSLSSEVVGLVQGLQKEVKEEELKRAIAKAKFEAASATETRDGLLTTVVPQLIAGKLQSLEDAFSGFTKVSTSSVAKTAEQLFKNKPTVVAVGDLSVLPYADELKL
jgi:ubiquinol-cytochrome c reductase core subunit 2